MTYKNYIVPTFLALTLISLAFFVPQIVTKKPSVTLTTSQAALTPQAISSAQDVHRFWSEKYKHHFYTISETEKNSIIANDENWAYEGVAYSAFTTNESNTEALYRFYSPTYKGHFFTSSETEKDHLVENDFNWDYEGIGYYIKTQGTPIYRFYSANLQGHFYTTSEAEKDSLIANDPNWAFEGIAFYGEGPTDPEEENTTLPVITSLGAKDSTQNTITILWTTDTQTTATISYGLAPNTYTQTTAQTSASQHTLTDLAVNTQYYYVLTVEDTNNNVTVSSERIFTTGSQPIQCGNGIIESGEQCDDSNTTDGDGCSSTCQTEISPFILISEQVTNTTQASAEVLFAFSKVGQAYIEYGTTTAYGNQSDTETSFNHAVHSLSLAGLSSSTTYHYHIRGTSQESQTIISGDQTFTTASPTNQAPTFSGSISNFSYVQGASANLSLASYFSDPESQVLTYSLAPSSDPLPAGLSLTSDGRVAGTATTIMTSAGVVLRTTDPGNLFVDSNAFSVTIRPSGPTFSGNISDFSYEQGASANLSLASYFSDTDSLTYGLSPSSSSLPSGLSITSDGRIAGTPTTPTTATNIIIRATNTGSLFVDSNAFTVTIRPIVGATSVAPGTPVEYSVSGNEVTVSTAQQLLDAISGAEAGDVITVADGQYALGSRFSIYPNGTVANPIVLRAANPHQAVITFSQSGGTVEGFVTRGRHWIIDGLTITSDCTTSQHTKCEHGIHIKGTADDLWIRNNQITEFNASIKGSGSSSGNNYSDNVRIEHNDIYNTSVRMTNNPVTPIDVNGGDNWIIYKNRIADFSKGGSGGVSYGAFLKANSTNGLFDSNWIQCEENVPGSGARIGLSFGGGGNSPIDSSICKDSDCSHLHRGGRMTNNYIANCSDVGIYLNKASDTILDHNTLYETTGIDVRYDVSTVDILGNVLVGGDLSERNGGNITANSQNTIVNSGSANTQSQLMESDDIAYIEQSNTK